MQEPAGEDEQKLEVKREHSKTTGARHTQAHTIAGGRAATPGGRRGLEA